MRLPNRIGMGETRPVFADPIRGMKGAAAQLLIEGARGRCFFVSSATRDDLIAPLGRFKAEHHPCVWDGSRKFRFVPMPWVEAESIDAECRLRVKSRRRRGTIRYLSGRVIHVG